MTSVRQPTLGSEPSRGRCRERVALAVFVLIPCIALLGVGASVRSLAQRIRSETGDEPMVFVCRTNCSGGIGIVHA